MKRNILILLVLLCRGVAEGEDWPTLSPALRADTITGIVTRVIDGDTVMLRITPEDRGGMSDVRVRLGEIDAPELRQPHGREAAAALTSNVLGRIVRVNCSGRDRYRRIIGTVLLGDRIINRDLVAHGHAWVYRKYSRDPALAALETAARKAKAGLWATGEAGPPWEFRQTRRKKTQPRMNADKRR